MDAPASQPEPAQPPALPEALPQPPALPEPPRPEAASPNGPPRPLELPQPPQPPQARSPHLTNDVDAECMRAELPHSVLTLEASCVVRQATTAHHDTALQQAGGGL